jgi:hypothetical protein
MDHSINHLGQLRKYLRNDIKNIDFLIKWNNEILKSELFRKKN